MKFLVFSYNRGPFLRNCVESIERCAPEAQVIVFDDRSTDPDTVRVLEQLSARHNVVLSRDDDGNKHGGLYGNMQTALESLSGNDPVCFTQDDTQLIRNLEEEDYQFIADCFKRHPTLGFISPAFIRGITLKRKRTGTLAYDADASLYFWQQNTRSAGVHYSDIFISTPERLRSRGWRFLPGEPANNAQARSTFSKMGYLKMPFLMWLPNGIAYRGKKKTLALRLAEKHRHCGFYPFQYLTPAEVERLRARPPSELPVAERFLKPMSETPLPHPWIYNALQGSRFLKHLNRAELWLEALTQGN